jgi:two-component system, chemotaxis family, chemotaxis protein CheY
LSALIERNVPVTNDVSMPILVVDDSDTVCRIISNMLLNQLGFQKVTLAHGGITALAKMRGENYSLIISDWNMHPMTGLDLLKQVRSEITFAKTRFIIVTANSSTNHVLEAKAAGVDGYIVKPFTAQVLKARIDAIRGKISHQHIGYASMAGSGQSAEH